MKKTSVFFVLPVLPFLPLMATLVNPPLASRDQVKSSKTSPRANCNTSVSAGAGNGCVDLRIPFGRHAHMKELSPGYISLHKERPVALTGTPTDLDYRLFTDSAIDRVATNGQTLAVTVMQANGDRIQFDFAQGQSLGLPAGTATVFANRLQRFDASGVPVTNLAGTVALYDHWYSDGSRIRFEASTGRSLFVETESGMLVHTADLGVEIIRDPDSRALRQIVCPVDGLADIVAVDGATYELRLYPPQAVGTKDAATGLYAVDGEPLVIWSFSSPERDAVKVTESGGGRMIIREWAYNPAVEEWDYSEADGLRRTVKLVEWDSSRSYKYETEMVFGADRALAGKTRTVSYKHGWGLATVKDIRDFGGLNLTTETGYYQNSSEPGRYGKPKWISRPDKDWIYLDYDSQGRVTNSVTPWLGLPNSAYSSVGEMLSKGRAVITAYEPHLPGDTPGVVDARPRTVEVRVAGTPVSRARAAYVREADGSLTEIHETCTDLSAPFGDPSNLRTVVTRYSPGDANAAAASRVKAVLAPDGVLRSFAYEAGHWSAPAVPGAAAFTPHPSGKALKTTVTEGTPAAPDGIPGRTLRAVAYADARGDAVLSEIWARSASGFVRSAWSATAFDMFHNVTSRVDSAGSAASAAFLREGVPASAIDEAGVSYAYSYDVLGRPASVTLTHPTADCQLPTVHFSFDPLDRLTAVAAALPDGSARTLYTAAYDRAGRTVSVTDASGRTERFSYLNLASSVSTPLGYIYGSIVTNTLPSGGTLVHALYPGGLSRSVTGTAAAPPVWYGYGVSNGLFFTRATAGSENSPLRVTRYADPAGRPVRVQYADGLSESLAYDLCGRLTNALDRAGRATCFAWDEVGKPLSVSRQADAGFATVAFGLDLAALVSSVTNEAGACVSRVLRDIPARTVTETDITGGQTVARSDAAGRVTSVSRPDGVLVSNVLDVLGRPVEILHNGAPVLGMDWRTDGGLLAASNAAARIAWSRNAFGLATNEATQVSSFEVQVSRLLSSSALPTNTTLSVGSCGLSVERSFDLAGRFSSVTGGADGPSAASFRFGYSPQDGGLSSISNAVLVETQTRDLLGHVTNIVYRTHSGAALASFDYRRDIAGLVTQKVSMVGPASPPTINSYAYDALGRLTAADDAAYTYDSAGNRLTAEGTYGYYYNRNRLVMTNPQQFPVQSDAAGNVTRMLSYTPYRGISLSWDTQGQLLSAKTNNVIAESYTYDPLGRRLSTTDSSGTVWHVYDGGHCAADVDASGQPLRAYTWGPGIDNLLAVTVFSPDATNTCYAVKDHLGSVHALIDSSGTVAATYTYDAWGNVLSHFRTPELSNFSLRFLWQGREYSWATGLYNFRARWYSPELGRWLSPDPIGLEGGLNLYEFCGNDPVNFVDPYGLWAGVDDVVFIVGGAAIGMTGRLVGDVINSARSGSWEFSDWEDYTGAAAGGAVSGETLLYTANPILAGAAGGMAGNLVTQGAKLATNKQCEFDTGSLFFDTGIGALAGKIPGKPRIPGVNAGRGSDIQVFRQIVRKFQNETIRTVRPETAVRMARGAFYEYAAGQGAAAGAVGSTIYGDIFQ
jgi:RHS repeat-associated protein